MYRHGTLVGVVRDYLGHPVCLLPAVITPAGEAHSLHRVDTLDDALTEIRIAARQYTYLPHPIGVHIIRSGAGEVAYEVSCSTCHEGGLLSNPPTYAGAYEAVRNAETEHQRLTGQHGVLVEHPRALPRSGPPTNSPYFR